MRGLRGSSRSSPELCLDDFRLPKGFPANIGEGGFGRVLAMVKRDEPSRRFAVKCMNKAKIIHRKQVDNVLNELNILHRIEHYPYLVNLFYAFQDKNNLYMCTDLMLGGTLQRAMRKTENGNFADDPERIKLYAAELALAVQFLHANNVVHRDIKPDNVLLDANGHVHLTDFNVSIYVEPGQEETQKHNDGWGTRGYRAPEVYLRTGAGFIFACDWWSLGSLIFEMITGRVPYARLSKDEQSSDLLLRMNAENAEFFQIEDEISRDFLRKLLRFDPELRLGCQHGSNSEVMILAHPFYNGTDWDALEKYSNPNEIDLRGVTSEGSRTTDNSDLFEPPASIAGTEVPPAGIDSSNGAARAGQTSASAAAEGAERQSLSRASGRPAAGAPDIRNYMDNFDQSLDQKEKMRILQRNMGILGLNGFDNPEDDDHHYPPLTLEQQNLFKDWQFNVDFKLEQLQMPQFTLLQMVSSMSPEEIKSWIGGSKTESIRALCTEMKSYREQAMKENFDHVMAEMRIDRLIEENLRLTRRVAQLEQSNGIRQSADDPLVESDFGFQQPASLPLSRKSPRSSKASIAMAAAEVGIRVPEVERQLSMESTGAASSTSAVPPISSAAARLKPGGKASMTSTSSASSTTSIRPAVDDASPVSPSDSPNASGPRGPQHPQLSQVKKDGSPTGDSSVVLFDAHDLPIKEDGERLGVEDVPSPAPAPAPSIPPKSDAVKKEDTSSNIKAVLEEVSEAVAPSAEEHDSKEEGPKDSDADPEEAQDALMVDFEAATKSPGADEAAAPPSEDDIEADVVASEDLAVELDSASAAGRSEDAPSASAQPAAEH